MQKRTLEELILTPSHEPRGDDPYAAEYHAARHHAIIVLDTPCWVCGIRNSNGGKMESHHGIVEWSLANGIDPKKIQSQYPEFNLADQAAFLKWLDSEGNLLILCAQHHRGYNGIHSITYPPFLAQKYAKDGLELVADPKAARLGTNTSK